MSGATEVSFIGTCGAAAVFPQHQAWQHRTTFNKPIAEMQTQYALSALKPDF